jgi:hypothetical protein
MVRPRGCGLYRFLAILLISSSYVHTFKLTTLKLMAYTQQVGGTSDIPLTQENLAFIQS